MKIIKAIKTIGFVGCGFAAGALCITRLKNKVIKTKEDKIDKFRNYYDVLNHWMELKQGGKSLEEFFIRNNYRTIAIYGMGEMGCRLYSELMDSSIEVKYAIDQKADTAFTELKVVTIDEELEDVDVIVVSATFAFDDVKHRLSELVNCPVVSLEDVVFKQ